MRASVFKSAMPRFGSAGVASGSATRATRLALGYRAKHASCEHGLECVADGGIAILRVPHTASYEEIGEDRAGSRRSMQLARVQAFCSPVMNYDLGHTRRSPDASTASDANLRDCARDTESGSSPLVGAPDELDPEAGLRRSRRRAG